MMEFVSIVVLVALMAAWCLLLLMKGGVVEWLQIHGTEKVSEAANCMFCLSWWLCVVLSVMTAVAMKDCIVLAVPFFATPITRRLL
jgi:hypothetical protein